MHRRQEPRLTGLRPFALLLHFWPLWWRPDSWRGKTFALQAAGLQALAINLRPPADGHDGFAALEDQRSGQQSGLGMSRSAIDRELKGIISDVLGIDPEQAAGFNDETGLFGHLPELDSMAVAGLLTEMEDRLDIVIEDDDVDGEMLETYGGLLAFAEAKVIEG